MPNKLTLSIVIPVYNEEHHLKACLQSIANQSVAPDEVLVVDNNSQDASVQVARSFSFVTLFAAKNQGTVFARNTGFDAAKSIIIGRIDADTILPAHWVRDVKAFYDAGNHARQALTGGGYFYNLRLPRFNGWVLSQLMYRLNRFIVGYYLLWGSNMAFLRNQWQAVRHEVCNDDAMHEDLDLAIHLHNAGYRIDYHAGLSVGVYMKRLWENRGSQDAHLARWPYTLKTHNYRFWWLSLTGNFLIRYVGQPFAVICEYTGRLFGSKLSH